MKSIKILMSLVLGTLIFTQCQKDNLVDENPEPKSANSNTPAGMYTVTVENVANDYDFFESGVASIPDEASEAGPALPGQSYTFSFHAGPKHKLSFATMFGWSNDGFFAPDDGGISLYSGKTPVTGDITSMIMLWDAGTEMNQPPGESNPHDGANVTDGMVQLMSVADPANDYGTVSGNLEVNLEYNGNSWFTITVNNLADSKTPISPVVWVIHYDGQKPIFTDGQKDYGFGLENVAESGDAGPLSHYLSWNSGYVSPVAPFLWVLHDKKDMPIFTEGMPDYGLGLETLAETGDPGPLYMSLMDSGYVTGIQNLPFGGTMGMDEGPLQPGQKYEFTIEAHVGQTVSFASMLGNSNDEFFSTGDKGIKLSNGAAEMDITHLFEIYDAGTEPNEYPGAKIDNDEVEGGNVRKLDDGLPWPDASDIIKVTIKKNM